MYQALARVLSLARVDRRRESMANRAFAGRTDTAVPPQPQPVRDRRWSPGTWWHALHKWFLAAGPVRPYERMGYRVWGPIFASIGLTEILAAASKTLRNAIPWPTISSTVGHLEGRWPIVSVLVV